jgi:hypothetical protein
MSDFETISHKVSVAGRVTDSRTGKPVSKARVSITTSPAVFKSFLALRAEQYGNAWDLMPERPDRTITDENGHYHFLDLPGGKYKIAAMLSDRNTRYGKSSTEVDVSDKSAENFKHSMADIELPSNSVSGVVTDKDSGQPILFAEIRVRGSGESCLSNSKGEYSLNGFEAASRRLIEVSIRGYKPDSKNIKLSKPGTSKTLDFSLEPL